MINTPTGEPSLGYGIGLQYKQSDKTPEYQKVAERMYEDRQKKKAADDKTFDDIIKQAKSIDKGKFHQVVLPDVDRDINESVKKIYDLHDKNPNNYKQAATEEGLRLLAKMQTHAARSERLFAADKTDPNTLSPEGQQTQQIINTSRGKGYDYFNQQMQGAKTPDGQPLLDASGGYVGVGDEGGLTLKSRPKNFDLVDDIKKTGDSFRNEILSKAATRFGDPNSFKQLQGTWSSIPDTQDDVQDLVIKLGKGGIAIDPKDIPTKDAILDRKWSERDVQDLYKYQHRSEHLSDDELKQKFKEENKTLLGGKYKEAVTSIPQPRAAKAATYSSDPDGSFESDVFKVSPKEVNIENVPYTNSKLGFVITRKGGNGTATFSDVKIPYALDDEGKIVPNSSGKYSGNIRSVVPMKNPLTGRYELFAEMTMPDRVAGSESKKIIGAVSKLPIGSRSKKIIDKGQTVYVPYDDPESEVMQTINGATTPKKVGGKGWTVPQAVRDEVDKLNGGAVPKATSQSSPAQPPAQKASKKTASTKPKKAAKASEDDPLQLF